MDPRSLSSLASSRLFPRPSSIPWNSDRTLMGGTMFLMWLGEQITSRGIGNGSSLIIFAGIVAAFPSAIVNTLELRSDLNGRHDVFDVARRTDHLARHWQWILAHYLRWHRRGFSLGHRQYLGTQIGP